jgi:hypothetical protein
MVASSPVDNVPEHLLQTCVAYQHEVALIHRDLPPGDARETRLAEAMAHGAAVCTSATLEFTFRTPQTVIQYIFSDGLLASKRP